MSLTKKHMWMALSAMLLVLFAVLLTQGCGTNDRYCEAAPDLSTVTINPASQSFDTGGFGLASGANLPEDWTVVVLYSDKTPMPYACLNISGALAVQPGGIGAYQFQYYPSWIVPNAPVNSGFRARTDQNGQFTFSTLISGPVGTFKDALYARSGDNLGTASIELK